MTEKYIKYQHLLHDRIANGMNNVDDMIDALLICLAYWSTPDNSHIIDDTQNYQSLTFSHTQTAHRGVNVQHNSDHTQTNHNGVNVQHNSANTYHRDISIHNILIDDK